MGLEGKRAKEVIGNTSVVTVPVINTTNRLLSRFRLRPYLVVNKISFRNLLTTAKPTVLYHCFGGAPLQSGAYGVSYSHYTFISRKCMSAKFFIVKQPYLPLRGRWIAKQDGEGKKIYNV